MVAEAVPPFEEAPAAAKALESFLDGVKHIEGIECIATFPGQATGELSVLVLIPSEYTPAGEAVHTLHAEVLRTFPGVALDIQIDGMSELGLSPSDLPDWIPQGACIVHSR
jgi:hypothetical protein